MVRTNRAENFKSRASWHLQVENQSVWFLFFNTAHCFRRIAGLPREFHTWYIPQEIGKALDDYLRVICNKDLHFFLLEDHSCDSSE